MRMRMRIDLEMLAGRHEYMYTLDVPKFPQSSIAWILLQGCDMALPPQPGRWGCKINLLHQQITLYGARRARLFCQVSGRGSHTKDSLACLAYGSDDLTKSGLTPPYQVLAFVGALGNEE